MLKDMHAEFYLLKDMRSEENALGGIAGVYRQSYSQDLEADGRCYRALLDAAEALPRPERWMILYCSHKAVDGSGRDELIKHPSLHHSREMWPSRICVKSPRPTSLAHQFSVHPFLKVPVGDAFLYTPVVSRAWRSAIETYEPGLHTFLPLVLEFSDQIEVDYFYVFTKNVYHGGVDYFKLTADVWIKTNYDVMTRGGQIPDAIIQGLYAVSARQKALNGMHWMAGSGGLGGSEGFVVSGDLASHLRKLVLKRDEPWMTFLPITLFDD
jgi:hypothetical protein